MDSFDIKNVPAAAGEQQEQAPAAAGRSGEQALTGSLSPAEEASSPRTLNTPFRLKVKYNHQERELGYDEAVTLAQKGLNYDKLAGRLKELEEDEGFSIVSSLAAEYGVSRREVHEALKGSLRPGREREAEDFFRKYPGLSPGDIPEEVMERFYRGDNLTSAYEEHAHASEKEQLMKNIGQLREELERLREYSLNAERANPSAGTLGGATAGEVYASEELDTLSPEELSRNLDRAIRSMSYWSSKNPEKR